MRWTIFLADEYNNTVCVCVCCVSQSGGADQETIRCILKFYAVEKNDLYNY